MKSYNFSYLAMPAFVVNVPHSASSLPTQEIKIK